MTVKNIIEAFIILGQFLKQFQSNERNTELKFVNNKFYDNFYNLIEELHIYNPWFIKKFINIAISNIAEMLSEVKIKRWVNNYPELSKINKRHKNIGVVLAGNIPMVGFHDMLCVLISGNKFIGKLSSKDDKLITEIAKILIEINPEFSDLIVLETNTLKKIDAIIATGSNNSSRYFEYYFSKYPHIIRQNRNAVAVLDGKENKVELNQLSDDIFLFFGMGCRNVSKIMIPNNYNIEPLFQSFEKYNDLFNHHKYANNYEYNRTLLLMNKDKHYDNGFFLLRKDTSLSSPLSVLHYEEYSDVNKLENLLESQKENIQCVVTNMKLNLSSVTLGKAQTPELWDYADNVDTIDFLLNHLK